MIRFTQVDQAVGKTRHLRSRTVHNMRELDAIVRAGLPKSALDTFIACLTAPNRGTDSTVQLRNKIVSRATYQRVHRFNLQVGETTERLARLYALALSVFKDREAATQFMMNSHPELDARAPFDVALTEIGGREVVHAAETYALAVLENLVHWQTSALPPALMYLEVKIPDDLDQKQLDPVDMPASAQNDYAATCTIGDEWYNRGETAILWVPSVISPYESNILFNQRHRDFSRVIVGDPTPVQVDPRLR